MAMMGTGVIAGVANSALQSQQLGRMRDKRVRDAKRAAERQQEIREIRIHGLEEDDAAEDVTRIRIDGEVPDHERHNTPDQHHHDYDQAAADATPAGTYSPRAVPTGPTAEPPQPEEEADADPDAPPEPQAHVAAAYQHSDPDAEAKHNQHQVDLEG